MNSAIKNAYFQLETKKNELLKEISACPKDCRTFNPNPISWNMIEVAEHCCNIEKGILISLNRNKNSLIKPSRLSEARSFLLKRTLRSSLRFKAPEIKGILPEGNLDFEEVIEEWSNVRAQLYEFIVSFPDGKVDYWIFKHPMVGKLNLNQTLGFISEHTAHHIGQIKRIKKSYLMYH